MRPTALVPVVLLADALILSFLCTFAGTHKDMLEHYDIFTLNTSRIAVDIFNTTMHKADSSSTSTSSSSSNSSNPLTNFFHKVTGEIHNATNKVESAVEQEKDKLEADIETALNNALQSFAKTLGLHDFYSIHVLDHCEGFFHPNGTSGRNVTHCSNSTGSSHFSPAATLQAELNKTGIDVDLADLHWPEQIDHAVDKLKLAFNVLFVLYCIGIAAIGLALIGSVLGVFFQGRLSALGNIFLTQLAFFALLIASAIITAGATTATNAINKFGKDIDVSATRGNKLIAMTWAADALVFLASLAWLIECILGRRKEKMIPKSAY